MVDNEIIRSVGIYGGTSIGIMAIIGLIYKWCRNRKNIDADLSDSDKEVEDTFEGMKIIW